MSIDFATLLLIVAVIGACLFGVLNYTLRDLSRTRLKAALDRRRRPHLYQPTIDHAGDLGFMTAAARLFLNLVVLMCLIAILDHSTYEEHVQYLLAMATAVLTLLVFSLAIPFALAQHMGESILARFAGLMLLLWPVLSPVARIMHAADRLARRAARTEDIGPQQKQEEIEEQIIEAVEEGARTGVVDERQQQLIQRALDFEDATVADAMTPRKSIVSLPVTATLAQCRNTIESSGHSRVPVYRDTIDQVIGVLYARDLLRLWGEPDQNFELQKMLRKPREFPLSKPLRHVLQEFRLTKVHMGIVLDEHRGVAGLITIEDVMEEIVGEISDEYEPTEPLMFRQLDEHAADADARIELPELNRLLGLKLPEDADFTTLGGYVSHELGKIPQRGEVLVHAGVRYTITDSVPMRVLRVRIEVLPHIPVETVVTSERG